MEQTTSTRTSAARDVKLGRLVYWFGRRIIDIVASAVLIVILAPILLLISLAIWLDDGLPILYRCQRLGRYGQPITVLKFRTMHDGSHHHLEELLTADEERRLEYGRHRKLRKDPRRTRVGGFLRRFSLDELPQLINILSGQMSLIGPRPYLPDELRGRPEADLIVSVRPGLTGLWQVSGRADRTFEERVAYDVEYVRTRGFRRDLGIVVRTIGAVIGGRGAY